VPQDPGREEWGRAGTVRLAADEEVGVANNGAGAAGGGALYGLGIFGALVYFWQQADGFWEHAFSLLQAVFWPAWMVYRAFEAIPH
jgi:hypothetical protein